MSTQELNLTDAVVFEREVQWRITKLDEPLSLFTVDLSAINKIFSLKDAAAGQNFLGAIAKLLQRICRENDKIYRIGDCAFGIVFANVNTAVHQQLAAEKIVRLYESVIGELDVPYQANINIGIANYPEHAQDAHDLIRKSSVALEASRTTEDPFFLYQPDAVETLSLKWNLQEEVGIASTSRDFELNYLPKVSLSSGRVTGAEALLRWNSGIHGEVPPDILVAVAIEIGRVRELTQSILTTALRHSSEWRGASDDDYTVSLNLDVETLNEPELANAVASSLSIWGGENHTLMLEITESALTGHAESNFSLFNKLRSLGIGLSIDDYGTGSSSLSYLRNIPISELKIDRSFVANMLDSSADRKLVETIIDLGHRFDMQVVAEGVESAKQLELLKQMGCDLAQGYYFSKPLPHDEFCQWLADQ
jgi:EAL domain-containing protein (putative c-di-GMP-specific phosphodiesterase class I)/GGDEF domain-containing protein